MEIVHKGRPLHVEVRQNTRLTAIKEWVRGHLEQRKRKAKRAQTIAIIMNLPEDIRRDIGIVDDSWMNQQN